MWQYRQYQQDRRSGCGGCGCAAALVLVLTLLVVAGLLSAVSAAFAASPLLFVLIVGGAVAGAVYWWRRNVRVTNWFTGWQANPWGNPYAEGAYGSSSQEQRPPVAAIEEKSPYTVLGVPSTASDEEITQAYRQMAKQYHPDRVAHLGPEFQGLAEDAHERNQRRIRQAEGRLNKRSSIVHASASRLRCHSTKLSCLPSLPSARSCMSRSGCRSS